MTREGGKPPIAHHVGVETRYLTERERVMRALGKLGRRDFFKVSAAAAAAAVASGVDVNPHGFQPVRVTQAAQPGVDAPPFGFAYISDSHLYERSINDRFVRSLYRAIDDINQLDPQPDFVLFGGDLAQLGQASELGLGAQMLKSLKPPLRMMVGEHDWYFDMGEAWRDLFGEPTYSFEHKGVHFVVLNSVIEEDFWSARNMSPMERMKTVAGLDNGIQGRFTVGQEQRDWLAKNLAAVSATTPVVVFSHSPLYKYYRNWNFWTDDADEVQALFAKFKSVVVIHGHTHQVLTHRAGNMHFHGMLSTAWPWPYAPEGLPELTLQMNRPDPFDPQDGCGDGSVTIHPDGLADKLYNLWNRNPVVVSRKYTASGGKEDKPPTPNLVSY